MRLVGPLAQRIDPIVRDHAAFDHRRQSAEGIVGVACTSVGGQAAIGIGGDALGPRPGNAREPIAGTGDTVDVRLAIPGVAAAVAIGVVGPALIGVGRHHRSQAAERVVTVGLGQVGVNAVGNLGDLVIGIVGVARVLDGRGPVLGERAGQASVQVAGQDSSYADLSFRHHLNTVRIFPRKLSLANAITAYKKNKIAKTAFTGA